MLSIDRTTRLFVASVKDAIPDARVVVQKSRTRHGRSNYVYIAARAEDLHDAIKVRISDHPVGMRRALNGDESLFLHYLARPSSWSVWVSELVRNIGARKGNRATWPTL